MVGAVVLLAVVGIGSVFALRAVSSRATDTATEIVETPVTPPVVEQPAPEDPAAEEPAPADDGLITDAQARATVTAFMDARIQRDVELSNSYCTPNFLGGEWKDALKDDTWRPESYEVVNSAPDLMYVHVVVRESWPSGEEHWIYSVFLDPESGKPLIDGTLDPANVPELIPK